MEDILAEHGFDPSKFTLGVLCKRGHDFEQTGKSIRHIRLSGRYKGNAAGCVDCHKLTTQKYYEDNSDHLKNYQKEYKKQNPEKVKDRNGAYYKKNRDAISEKSKQYREAHKEELKVKSQNYRLCNKEAIRIQRQNHYRANAELMRERSRQYRNSNKGRIKRSKKAWYEINKDKANESCRKYYNQHRLRIQKINKIWRENNPEWFREYQRRKRAKNATNIVSIISHTDLNARLAEFQEMCAYCCSKKHEHWDHFIPRSCGGSHTLSNLLPSCGICNRSKYNADPEAWYKRQSFFSQKQWRKILRILGKTAETYNQIPLI